MSSRPLKFSVNVLGPEQFQPVSALVEEGRRAEAAGFDVVMLPDHLGMTSPLVPLVAIAEAAPSVKVSNLVINAAFYRPALLARDLASVDSATGGRLIIALGTGYVEPEFHAAGLPFPTPGARVKLLTEHVTEIRRLLSDPGHIPPPVQTPPPIMIAGVGDKLLAMGAAHADIISIASQGTEADLAERVAYVKHKAGDRVDDIELAFGFFQVSLDDHADLTLMRMLDTETPDDQVRSWSTVLHQSVEEAAERIHRLHEQFGITYFHLNKTPATSWDTMAKVLAAVK
jgi:probable F420-dependent oxidoreductase